MTTPESERVLNQPSGRLTDRQAAAIGRVAVLWAEAEWAMQRLIGRLAQVPSLLGYILTDKIGPDNRIGAIRSLINVHKVKYQSKLIDEDLLTEIADYMTSIGNLKDDRNFVVHSVWAYASDTHLSRFDIAATARSGMDSQSGPCERVNAIESFGEEIEKAVKLLWSLSARVPTIQPASLQKLYELESGSLRGPVPVATRLLQPKSFARLQRKAPDQQKKAKAKRA
jgi:hypothetical protein